MGLEGKDKQVENAKKLATGIQHVLTEDFGLTATFVVVSTLFCMNKRGEG